MTKASRALGVTQPALSAMLKKLELEVGTPLFHRTGRGVTLTEAGRVFLASAEDSLRAADQGVQAVRELLGLERGSIRVGGGATATTYLLPPVVSAVRKKHAGLRFYVREAGSSAVAAAVLSGELDLGIVTVPVTLIGEEDLVRVPLVEDELRLIVPRGHRLARPHADKGKPAPGRPGFRWKDLVDEPFVSFEAGSAVREMIDRSAAASGVTLRVVMELRSIESIMSMVAAGIGVGFVSRFALGAGSAWGEAYGDGLPCRDGALGRTLAIVRRRDREPSVAAAAFEKALLASVTKTRIGS